MAPFRLLPDFIIIGTQKGGTSSLYEHLAQHPLVFPALKKEVHFFDSENFAKGTNWYRGHFKLGLRGTFARRFAQGRAITGEASPYYLFYPHAPKRVAELLPKAKLVVMLRNPIDRALSHYYHQVRKGREPLSFEAAIEAEGERLKGEHERILQNDAYYSYPYWAYSYLARGIYADQLKLWFELFPREQLLFIKSEDFFTNPAACFKRTLHFLGLPEIDLQQYKKQNAGSYSSMPADIRHELTRYFRPHNERLYELLGINFAWESQLQKTG
jgi:hypothetical protein